MCQNYYYDLTSPLVGEDLGSSWMQASYDQTCTTNLYVFILTVVKRLKVSRMRVFKRSIVAEVLNQKYLLF